MSQKSYEIPSNINTMRQRFREKKGINKEGVRKEEEEYYVNIIHFFFKKLFLNLYFKINMDGCTLVRLEIDTFIRTCFHTNA